MNNNQTKDNIQKAAEELVTLLKRTEVRDLSNEEHLKRELVEKIGIISNQGIELFVSL